MRWPFVHQAKKLRSGTSAWCWLDQRERHAVRLAEKRDVALVGLEDRERDVLGPCDPAKLGPGHEACQVPGVAHHGHRRVVMDLQPLQPVGDRDVERGGVARVAREGDGAPLAPLPPCLARAHLAAHWGRDVPVRRALTSGAEVSVSVALVRSVVGVVRTVVGIATAGAGMLGGDVGMLGGAGVGVGSVSTCVTVASSSSGNTRSGRPAGR